MRLPVLCYHHVGPPRPGTYPGLTVSPEQFESHLRRLARLKYTGIRPIDWLEHCRGEAAIPEKPVLLAFDDGYADLAEFALPVMAKYGFPGVVFVVTSLIGKTNRWDEVRGSGTHRLLSAEQIRHWVSKGIEFGAHSRTHADLTSVERDELANEVAGSGDELASILGSPVVSFSYPYGYHNDAVRSCVRESFELAFGMEEGLNTAETDRYLLRRTMVQPSDSSLGVACRVRWGTHPVKRLRAKLRIRSRMRAALRYFDSIRL